MPAATDRHNLIWKSVLALALCANKNLVALKMEKMLTFIINDIQQEDSQHQNSQNVQSQQPTISPHLETSTDDDSVVTSAEIESFRTVPDLVTGEGVDVAAPRLSDRSNIESGNSLENKRRRK
ncbi:hypothetical protein DOY81_008381 [Sarcophaga bullata]|nr:hypothetical protein DOY81_008381 [Sarcophaga bullata]